MLPYQPMSIAENRARFPAAMETIWDVESALCGGPTPGMQEGRENVFDFPGGLRIIASRDRLPEGEVVIHFSASAEQGSALWRRIKRPGQERYFNWLAILRFAEISGFGKVKPAHVEFVGCSPGKGIPHWYVKEITEENALEILANNPVAR